MNGTLSAGTVVRVNASSGAINHIGQRGTVAEDAGDGFAWVTFPRYPTVRVFFSTRDLDVERAYD